METWLEISGYEGLYEVSSLGRVRSLDHWVKNRYSNAFRRGRILKQTPDRVGYMQVNLSKKNSVETKKAHRLVAEAFIIKLQSDASTVNHLDFNKANNAATNLEWCTAQKNFAHAVKAGRLDAVSSSRRAKKLSVQTVREIRLARETGGTWRGLAKQYDISTRTLGMILNRKIWANA